MDRLAYTYALIKSLYDQGGDYIDSFWSFAIKIFSKERAFLNLDVIQRRIKENFALVIPLHTLRTILNRAKKRGYGVIRKNPGYLRTKSVVYDSKIRRHNFSTIFIRDHFSTLRVFFNYCSREGLIEENPISGERPLAVE